MPVSLQQVLRQLDTDEPNYTALAALGPDAVPQLAVLVRGEDPGLAAKAAYLASMIPSDDTMEVLSSAAASPHETVRVAAAAGLRNVASAQALSLTDRLLDDADPGVRKLAIRTATQTGMEALEPKLRMLASRDSEPGLRQMAREGLNRASDARKQAGGEAVRAKPPKRSTKSRARRKK